MRKIIIFALCLMLLAVPVMAISEQVNVERTEQNTEMVRESYYIEKAVNPYKTSEIVVDIKC